jgi:hypothetical protein
MRTALALAALAFALLSPIDDAPAQTPALERDTARLITAFDSRDSDLMDEALIQLRWAGVTDARLYEHLLTAVLREQKSKGNWRARYLEALRYAGNPQVYARLEQVANDPATTRDLKSELLLALREAPRYGQIAETMAVGTENATTYEQLWAIRHRNGLRVDDPVRLRWAARDLYLHKYGRDSLDVAAEELRRNAESTIEDNYVEDAMAFLCKALGLAGNAEYLPLLKEIANTAKNEKLQRYAERSAQYYDTSFKRTSAPLQKRRKAGR